MSDNPEMEIVIDEWAESAHERLDEFVNWWKANAAKGDKKFADQITFGEAFPLSLPLGEWEEHWLMSSDEAIARK